MANLKHKKTALRMERSKDVHGVKKEKPSPSRTAAGAIRTTSRASPLVARERKVVEGPPIPRRRLLGGKVVRVGTNDPDAEATVAHEVYDATHDRHGTTQAEEVAVARSKRYTEGITRGGQSGNSRESRSPSTGRKGRSPKRG